jgi:L-fuculose-phosphate aldolase
VTASGTWLDRLSRRDFVRVRIADGAPVSPDDPPASSEVALHLHTYRARPDVNAVVHLHPQSLLLLDALGERIRLVTTDHVFYLREVVRVGFHRPGTQALAAAAAGVAAGGANCVVLAHHGCSVLADTVALARKRARYLEEAAQLTYRALVLGRPDVPECPPEFRRYLDQHRPPAV